MDVHYIDSILWAPPSTALRAKPLTNRAFHNLFVRLLPPKLPPRTLCLTLTRVRRLERPRAHQGNEAATEIALAPATKTSHQEGSGAAPRSERGNGPDGASLIRDPASQMGPDRPRLACSTRSDNVQHQALCRAHVRGAQWTA